ncbi:glycosyl hydrolase family 8 [Microvirga antarctica]|uniref:glycosyl hydrolase family 8 n=1 Tax=Microvirga antarctica TaxID=2819233 RepID=UPI001B3009B6|nr:glycosyl hydrolase family 8 [Microvirga antarctica]
MCLIVLIGSTCPHAASWAVGERARAPLADSVRPGPAPKEGQGLPENWLATAWDNYKRQFVRSGRVIDDVNKISHSEGQGYAMLIATKASDRAAFDEIWNWTRKELYIDPSDLAAWQWKDKSTPNVTDRNNATDGDILIAWALLEAGEKWHSPDYVDAARKIASAIGRSVVAEGSGGAVLLPGRTGFTAKDQPDGMVLNLSYWVFPAFERLKGISPEIDWNSIQSTGLRLIRESRFGPTRLPSEWIAVDSGKPAPAQAFPSRFSYNAIRIPLYLAWSTVNQRDLLRPFAGLWNDTLNLGPFEVELPSGAALDAFGGNGFKAVVATAKCAVDRKKLPAALQKIEQGSYYSTTLHILSLIALQERYPECL